LATASAIFAAVGITARAGAGHAPTANDPASTEAMSDRRVTRCRARVRRPRAELALDVEQAVVLADPVRPAQRARLDLTAARAHREVGDGGVLGLAGAVRDHGGPAGLARHANRIEGLGEGSDLVQLDQDRVGSALRDPALEDLGVGHEDIVADDLDAVALLRGLRRPAGPVPFGEAVLDGADGIAGDPVLVEGDHLLRGLRGPLALEHIAAVLVDLGSGRVQGDGDVLARAVAGLLDTGEHELDGLAVARQVGRKAALVADGRGEPLRLEDRLELLEDFGPPAKGFGEVGRAHREDHELLEVDRVVRVGAAVDHVHHRSGHQRGRLPADVPVERDPRHCRSGVGRGERHAEDGVCAEARLRVGAVELDHGPVERRLLLEAAEGETGDGLGDLAVHVLDRFEHPLAAEALRVAVAQLEGLAGARRSPRRNRRLTPNAVRSRQLDAHGRISARIQNLPSLNCCDRHLRHLFLPRFLSRKGNGVAAQLAGPEALRQNRARAGPQKLARISHQVASWGRSFRISVMAPPMTGNVPAPRS
jgi:hypothetical protein